METSVVVKFIQCKNDWEPDVCANTFESRQYFSTNSFIG